jgi:sec-independent protein translocase protein TatA
VVTGVGSLIAVVGIIPSVGPVELLLVLGLLIFVFGASKVPRLARSIGQAFGELRNATHDEPDARGPETE